MRLFGLFLAAIAVGVLEILAVAWALLLLLSWFAPSSLTTPDLGDTAGLLCAVYLVFSNFNGLSRSTDKSWRGLVKEAEGVASKIVVALSLGGIILLLGIWL